MSGTSFRWMILGGGIILLPLILLLLRSPRVRTLLPFSRQSVITERYSVQSDAAGYALSLADTRYLDYVMAQLDLFARDAVIDPQFYVSPAKNNRRMQVNRIRFVLVDRIERAVSTIVEGDGRDTPITVIATGGYAIEGETLVVRVAVRFDALKKSFITKKFAWENAFLRAAVNAMYYALGDTDPTANRQELRRMKGDIDQNLYTGIMSWPFRIEENP